MKKIHDKLVRDNIPEILAGKEIPCQWHYASPSEYKVRLLKKLEEEVAEFKRNPTIEELADIYEVILHLSSAIGKSRHELETLRMKKQDERGGFFKKIILEWTEEE